MLGLVAAFATASTASAAVFVSTPPELTTTNGAGPFTWTFETDAPGTMWGFVSWRVSNEPYWHTCEAGSFKTLTLSNLAIGAYTVEIADEINDATAGSSLYSPPWNRCSESHNPPQGPGHPVSTSTLSVVASSVVMPPVSTPPATPTSPAPIVPTTPAVQSCQTAKAQRQKLIAAVRVDHRRLKHSKTKAQRARWRTRLAADVTQLRSLRCP